MKRIAGLLILSAFLAAPSLAFAEGQPAGIYIAPKFVYGATWMNKFGVDGVPYAGGGNYVPIPDDKSDTKIGGALAIGYDFGKQTKAPVRFELEYSMFSATSAEEPLYGSKVEWSLSTGGFVDPVRFSAKQRMKMQTLFVNAYYDFRNDTPFSFWLGAGAGVALIESKGNFAIHIPEDNYAFGSALGVNDGPAYTEYWSAGSKRTKNFAWNVGAGVGYDLTSNLTLDIGYRFASLGRAETESGRGAFMYIMSGGLDQTAKVKQIYMHQFMLGLRVTF
ncbi:MAG: outer membrane beta-barrel protein [Syntrophorhabdaceae bacterium]|nr:outer membrane beta-barrel protein [Syntrophorhabdaceae bacterium]